MNKYVRFMNGVAAAGIHFHIEMMTMMLRWQLFRYNVMGETITLVPVLKVNAALRKCCLQRITSGAFRRNNAVRFGCYFSQSAAASLSMFARQARKSETFQKWPQRG